MNFPKSFWPLWSNTFFPFVAHAHLCNLPFPYVFCPYTHCVAAFSYLLSITHDSVPLLEGTISQGNAPVKSE